MDMGTTNTRLWLCSQNSICHSVKAAIGAGITKFNGKEYLFSEIKNLIGLLLTESHADISEIDCIIASGMVGSELGISEAPRLPIPADSYSLAANLQICTIPEITAIPFLIVPGIKKSLKNDLVDVIRGEETEVAGIVQVFPEASNAVLVLPGSHNKVIRVENGVITDFYTTMSGELLHSILSGTILSGSACHQFSLKEQFVLQGALYGREHGINAALFHIRVMALNGMAANVLSSFLHGCVLGQDIENILKFSEKLPIYVGGNEILKRVYCILLGEKATSICEEISTDATRAGLSHILNIHRNLKKRDAVLKAIAKEKLIAIVRDPDEETLLSAVKALYNGGIRLIEVTFDRSGKVPKTKTAALINLIKNNTPMLVGAGTVTCQEELLLAYHAGASFIISPNCDTEIIKKTRKLGLTSIPAGFTPTEIADAIHAGADYVKVFPADALPKGYVKAIKAPLSDAKLLAVGGVSKDNAKDFLSDGFSGIGIGSGLYNKSLIAAKDWDGLTALAKTFVKAVKYI